MILALAIGIIEAATYPDYHTFVSNQSDNTTLTAITLHPHGHLGFLLCWCISENPHRGWGLGHDQMKNDAKRELEDFMNGVHNAHSNKATIREDVGVIILIYAIDNEDAKPRSFAHDISNPKYIVIDIGHWPSLIGPSRI